MAGYSQTPLIKKLGIKPNSILYFHQPPADFFDAISPLPEGVDVKETLLGSLDFIHLFVSDKKTFKAQFVKSAKALKMDGMLWVSWPKKSSKVPSDLDENIIRDYGLEAGLVDVKVCAVDDVWSGLKFVRRLRDRK